MLLILFFASSLFTVTHAGSYRCDWHVYEQLMALCWCWNALCWLYILFIYMYNPFAIHKTYFEVTFIPVDELNTPTVFWYVDYIELIQCSIYILFSLFTVYDTPTYIIIIQPLYRDILLHLTFNVINTPDTFLPYMKSNQTCISCQSRSAQHLANLHSFCYYF